MKSSRKKNKKKVGGTLVRRRGSGRKGPSHIAKRPFVAVTFAMTVDGKITTKNFTPVDFTSREDKMHLLRQRALGRRGPDRAQHSEARQRPSRIAACGAARSASGPRSDALSLARDCFQRRADRFAPEDFSIGYLADRHLLYCAHAAALSETAAPKSDPSPERCASRRARVDAATTAQRVRDSIGRLRRRRDTFPRTSRRRSGRSTQSHDRALYVRWRGCAHPDRPEQGFFPAECSMLVGGNANSWRGMLSYLSNQAPAMIAPQGAAI